MCDIELDGDTCDVWINTWHTARKPRACEACKTVIAPREKYMRHFDLFDGAVNVEFLCAVCGQAAEAFHNEHHCSPQSPAGVRYMIRDCIENSDDAGRARWQPVLDVLDARREASRRR